MGSWSTLPNKREGTIMNKINFIPEEVDKSTENILNSIYNASDRYYHTVTHINDMLNRLTNLSLIDEGLQDKIDFKLLRIAIIFHDIIQFEDNNELRSAEVTKKLIGDIYDADQINNIYNWIIRTDYSYYYEPEDLEGKLIRDLDLSGLGASEEVYRHNGYLVRQEYQGSNNRDFIVGRIQFLQKMLDFPKIYQTDYYKDLEFQARLNTETELERLLEQYKCLIV